MFSGTSNPLATTEEIQKRLVRPSSSSSSHRSSATPFSTIRSQNHGDPMETRKVNMNKLEDYLDPILLSAIRSKMKNIDRRGEEKEVKSRVSRGFEWPSTELNFFMEDSDYDDSRVVKRRKKLISDGVVNLRDDLDGEIVPIEEEHEEEQVEGCSPFGRFEITVSKLFGN